MTALIYDRKGLTISDGVQEYLVTDRERSILNVLTDDPGRVILAWDVAEKSGVEWPFPGIEVAPMDTMTAVTVTGVVASDPVPLSSVMVAGETPSVPTGLVAGEKIYALAVGGSAGWPSSTAAAAAGWANVTINGDGPTGTTTQVAFRLMWKTWVDGDVMPAFTGATHVEAYRVPAN